MISGVDNRDHSNIFQHVFFGSHMSVVFILGQMVSIWLADWPHGMDLTVLTDEKSEKYFGWVQSKQLPVESWADDGRYPLAKSPQEKAHSPCKTSYFSDHQTCICFIIIIRRLSFAVVFSTFRFISSYIYNHPQVDRMWNFQTYSVLVRIVRNFYILSPPRWLYIYPLVI